MQDGVNSATRASSGRSMNDDLNLAQLTKELQALEAGTFEIGDYAETGDLMSFGCSSGDLCSCACTSSF
jgi:hypothetical protein